MRIIVPMAGRGSRLRPHTLITPKPLVPIAGKPIVERLVEDIVRLYDGTIEEIAFIVGDFGEAVNEQLRETAERLGTRAAIFQQEEPLGTAHAIFQAAPSLHGEVIVAFADTLFRANFRLDRDKDAVIWTKQVENPNAFGVVKLDDQGLITDFVEKPQTFVSDEAIIGIYYFRDGGRLRTELQRLIDEDIRVKGEYQLTDALEHLRWSGARMGSARVDDWMDCGNVAAVLDTTRRVLDYDHQDGKSLIAENAKLERTEIIHPCYIGEGVEITESVVGPYASIGRNSRVHRSVISSSTVREDSVIRHAVLHDSMIGTHASCELHPIQLDLGDYSGLSR